MMSAQRGGPENKSDEFLDGHPKSRQIACLQDLRGHGQHACSASVRLHRHMTMNIVVTLPDVIVQKVKSHTLTAEVTLIRHQRSPDHHSTQSLESPQGGLHHSAVPCPFLSRRPSAGPAASVSDGRFAAWCPMQGMVVRPHIYMDTSAKAQTRQWMDKWMRLGRDKTNRRALETQSLTHRIGCLYHPNPTTKQALTSRNSLKQLVKNFGLVSDLSRAARFAVLALRRSAASCISRICRACRQDVLNSRPLGLHPSQTPTTNGRSAPHTHAPVWRAPL